MYIYKEDMEDEEDTTVIDRPNDLLETPENKGERRRGVPSKTKKTPKPKEAWELVFQDAKALPHDQQTKLFNALAEEKSKSALSTLEKIKQNYTPFPQNVKMTVENIIAHLKNELANYLTAFGAKKDSIYLDQLRQIEPLTEKMYEKLRYEHKKNASSPLFTDFVKKKTERTDSKVISFSKEGEEFIKVQYDHIVRRKKSKTQTILQNKF